MVKELAWRGLARADSHLRFSSLVAGDTDVILTYHSVGDPSEYGDVTPERFRSDLEFLTEAFDVVDLGDFREGSDGDGRRAAVTFDDGLRSVYTEALPLLREYDVPATVFVVTEAIDGDPPGLNAAHTMTEAQIDALVEDRLVTVGNHTRTHPRLSALPAAEREREIRDAKADLEARFGIDVDRFSYPFGDLDRETAETVRESHDLAVTTSPGHVTPRSDPVLLPRIATDRSAALTRWEASVLGEKLRSGLVRLGLSDGRGTDI